MPWTTNYSIFFLSDNIEIYDVDTFSLLSLPRTESIVNIQKEKFEKCDKSWNIYYRFGVWKIS